ncbi:DUF2254 domain-containing protein [Cognatishimia sp. F0-27]|uniref:DUF2254 domain-containing protein n=1 Tax=Cognatishimia sp. F0-27 TaxID=2816855 RepID=UPI001D0CC796|nr:DUF2254 domain-containing protein [Cognatishimia sp. F0-27]MCC1491808.1 DUF2254 domain-containing protein [Cognatishimia sp. F0-27]
MIGSLLRRLRQLSRRIHVRVILFALLVLVALAMAKPMGPLIPERLGEWIGADALDPILATMASSMLAVTIFSLTIMQSALANAASAWTPRSHLILREDTVTHSVLANFLGAYLFALLAIILRAADLFDPRESVVLFGMTIVVVVIIVVSLIRWIVHLEGLGSLPFTARVIEREARAALEAAALTPCHGGHALTDPGTQIPNDAVAIKARQAGYLQQIFEPTVQEAAEEHDLRVYIVVSVGQYVLTDEVMAFVAAHSGAPDPDALTRIGQAMMIDDARSFEQDPVFGLTVLAEIATRALSPGVNDPGTAIDIAHRLTPVLAAARTGVPRKTGVHDRIWSPPLEADRLFDASYDPIARYAGSAVEVHRAVLRALGQVATATQDDGVREAARAMQARCLERARAAIRFEADLEALEQAVQQT